jgi:ABC-type nitrate/sulfonate/bicarbonate transport system permease component
MPETLTATTHVGITRLDGRIAMAGAWTSIVAAELIAATSGLGYLIMQAGDYLNTALVFSGIIMIAILGLALDACLRGLLLLADPSRRR